MGSGAQLETDPPTLLRKAGDIMYPMIEIAFLTRVLTWQSNPPRGEEST